MNQQLCPNCRVGKALFELDPGNPECPYIAMNNGKSCARFEEINRTDLSVNDMPDSDDG